MGRTFVLPHVFFFQSTNRSAVSFLSACIDTSRNTGPFDASKKALKMAASAALLPTKPNEVSPYVLEKPRGRMYISCSCSPYYRDAAGGVKRNGGSYPHPQVSRPVYYRRVLHARRTLREDMRDAAY